MRPPRLVASTSGLAGAIDEARREFEKMRRRGDLVYERTCAKCGEPTFGAIGGLSSNALRVPRAEADRILANDGRFVCSNCDPTGKERWMMEVGTKLGLA
jgi:hypothetical protein